VDNMVRRIVIATDSRRSDDLVIVARTYARGMDGFDTAIERAQAYADAGADIVFVEALRSREETP